MQETALRPIGEALILLLFDCSSARLSYNGRAAVNTKASAVHREICSEHATHHMLPVQQRLGLEVLVVILSFLSSRSRSRVVR